MEWELSHAMASIGNGYIWPNIHVLSDGPNIALVSKPTPERECTPYRYINDAVISISAADFEREVDLFIETVLCRLEDRQIAKSNLADVWQAVLEERQDDAVSQKRKLEALLGEDPGEMDEASLQRLLNDVALTGRDALEEIAANRALGQNVPDIGALIDLARKEGVSVCPENRVRLVSDTALSAQAMPAPAWEVGAKAAQSLRKQLRLDPEQVISNSSLAEFYGAPVTLLDDSAVVGQPRLDLSLALTERDKKSRVLLRSKWGTGRRFELARLLGDHVVYATEDPMCSATRSTTYRQKVQRAFAAELLSPFQSVDTMLDGDYSMESQQEVAHHFVVSEMTVRTLLVNHKRISRNELEEIY
ncbi:ImmA/IrrE family metallo-endopeptidase [Acidiferrobacter sp.]